MDRNDLIKYLLQNFFKALLESLKPFQTDDEKVDYLETIIGYLKGAYSYEEPIPEFGIIGNLFDFDGYIRKHILLKYKDKAKPFVDTGLRYYMDTQDHLKARLFERLKLTDPVLDETEYDHYANLIHALLHDLIQRICIDSYHAAVSETEKDLNELPEGTHPQKGKFKSSSKEYTRKRQMLLYYFLLKLIGVNRSNVDLTAMAEFAHWLFAWPTDNVKSGPVYDLLKKAPDKLYESAKNYLSDLEFIKILFERINYAEGIALVQKEIDALKNR